MKFSKLLFIFFLLLSQISYSESNSDKIIIDSILTKCIKIKINKFVNYQNSLFIDTSWNIKNNIGSCGCKSALIRYDVNLISDNQHIISGLVSSLHKDNYKFIINSDISIFKNERFKLTVNCAN